MKNRPTKDERVWMNDTDNISIVFFSYYRFEPGYMEQVVENVFSEEIGRSLKIIFLLQGDTSEGKIQQWNNALVWLTPLSPFGGIFGSIGNALLSLNKFLQFARIARRESSLIVFVRDQPLVAALLGFMKCFLGYRLFFQYSAPLGEMRLESFHLHRSWKKYVDFLSGILLQGALPIALKKADIIFPITQSFAESLAKYYEGLPMVPLTMGVDVAWVNRRPHEIPLLEELARSSFIIGYFGTLSSLRRPDFLIRVLHMVKRSVSESKLLLMGDVAYPHERKELESLCRNLGVEHDVIFTGNLDKDSLQDYLQYCHLTLCPIPPVPYYTISSPTKLYESLAHGIPVVANSGIFEQEKVVSESQGGIIVSYDVDSFAMAAIELYEHPEERLAMGKRGKKYIIDNYTYTDIAKNIIPYFLDQEIIPPNP